MWLPTRDQQRGCGSGDGDRPHAIMVFLSGQRRSSPAHTRFFRSQSNVPSLLAEGISRQAVSDEVDPLRPFRLGQKKRLKRWSSRSALPMSAHCYLLCAVPRAVLALLPCPGCAGGPRRPTLQQAGVSIVGYSLRRDAESKLQVCAAGLVSSPQPPTRRVRVVSELYGYGKTSCGRDRRSLSRFGRKSPVFCWST